LRVITDTNVAPHYAKHALSSLTGAGFEPSLVKIPAGERAKRMQIVERCCEQLAKHRLERKSFIVALGGGVVGDLAGFVAASYLRGIDFVQVPTTLLAQVDSSVGGKVGVNLKAGKKSRRRVPSAASRALRCRHACDPPATRAARRTRRVIKYGIIYDRAFFERLEKDLPQLLKLHPATVADVVARCCEIKAEVVGKDERESGLRAILNFGHTVGHALEAISGYGKYLHGEAISIGQVAAARLSNVFAGLPADEATRIEDAFTEAGLPVSVRLKQSDLTGLARAMQLDKKVSGGDVRFVLARRIGEVVWGQKVPVEDVIKALHGGGK
jgi:3-dehydroquinate synthase